MMRHLIALILAALPGLAQGSRTVLDGVYTDAQAKRGEAAYGMNCAKCHEGADVDGPPLNGDPFIDRWREDRLSTLFTFIRTNMPRDTPGKLPEASYRDILAFLLQSNGYPTGSAELAATDSIQLVGKDGPKPLPTNALVLAVGCFAPGDQDTGMLTRVSALARTRTADATTPEELKQSAAMPSGDRQFRLQNLSEFKPESVKGHRVQVKGVLIRQANNDRINVTALESLAASCQ
jgi:quinoprotein glucose dehydrogenase